MGFLTNLMKPFRSKADTKPTRANPTGYETASYGYQGLSSDKQTEFLKEMKGWVFSCINAISDEIAAIDIKLYRKKGDKVEEVTEHEILDLLFKVNNYTTKFDQFWLTSAYLELVGEAPWFLEKTGNTITNIYFLRPDRLEIIPDKKTIIGGYKYDIGEHQKVTLKPDEVVFLKYPNPLKPLRGLGTLEAAARTVDVDNYSEEWNWRFFKQNATPNAILTVPNKQMTSEQKNKLKASIKRSYEGIDKAHQIMVLFGDMELEKFGFSQQEMGFEAQQKMTRDKILGIFRVPKAIVSQTEGTNFASAKVANYVFARWTIQPKMERLIQQLNEFLVPMFPDGENLFLDYENPIPADEEAKLNYYSKAIEAGWMSINEIRAKEGLAPLNTGGDSIYKPLSLVPIGSTPEQKTKSFEPSRLTHLHARTKLEREAEKKTKEILEKTKQKTKQDIMKGLILKKDLKKGLKDEIKKEIDNYTNDESSEGKILADNVQDNGRIYRAIEKGNGKDIRGTGEDNTKEIKESEGDKSD